MNKNGDFAVVLYFIRVPFVEIDHIADEVLSPKVCCLLIRENRLFSSSFIRCEVLPRSLDRGWPARFVFYHDNREPHLDWLGLEIRQPLPLTL